MKCKKCQKDIPANARFCLHCGEPSIIQDEDIKSRSDISISWLKNVFEKLNHSIKDMEDNPNVFIARIDDRYNILIGLNPDFISFRTFFNLSKKSGWGRKDKLLTAVNNANSLNYFLTWTIENDLTGIMISSFIYLTESISSKDIISFFDIYDRSLLEVIERSKLFEI